MKKRVLLFSSFFVLPVMMLIFFITTELFGAINGYLVGLTIYWCYCAIFILILSDKSQFLKIFRLRLNSKRELMYYSLAFFPIIGVAYVNFFPYLKQITFQIFLLVAITSIINGVIEEIYWRGLYLIEFEANTIIGLWLSTFLFSTWHISIYFISNINFGGFIPLVFGAAFMGLVWAYCSRKLQSIMPVIIAHILVNIFAFTGLYIKNDF